MKTILMDIYDEEKEKKRKIIINGEVACVSGSQLHHIGSRFL